MVMVMMMVVVMIMVVMVMIVVLRQNHWPFRVPLVWRRLGLGPQDTGRMGDRV